MFFFSKNYTSPFFLFKLKGVKKFDNAAQPKYLKAPSSCFQTIKVSPFFLKCKTFWYDSKNPKQTDKQLYFRQSWIVLAVTRCQTWKVANLIISWERLSFTTLFTLTVSNHKAESSFLFRIELSRKLFSWLFSSTRRKLWWNEWYEKIG